MKHSRKNDELQNSRRSLLAVFTVSALPLCLAISVILTAVSDFALQGFIHTLGTFVMPNSETARSFLEHQRSLVFAQYNEPPASPCTVVSYAVCNYPLLPNDSVAYSLANQISFTNCPAEQVSTATITFQATPSVPLFVWLSNATTTTPKIYMTGGTQTITKAWFDSGGTSWFGGGPWTTLNVQAIYPSPPPTTYFYPISCTIVYQ